MEPLELPPQEDAPRTVDGSSRSLGEMLEDGGQEAAKMGPSWTKLGPSWGQVAIWSHLGGILEATWPKMAKKIKLS